MDTPIYDFVTTYRDSSALRLHMPGHKGMGMLGVEALDITEIDGADVLYSAKGIIRQSDTPHTLYDSTSATGRYIRYLSQLPGTW